MSLLYFDYEIIAETPRTPDMPSNLELPPIVLNIEHIDDFSLPPCYPQTTADLMTRISETDAEGTSKQDVLEDLTESLADPLLSEAPANDYEYEKAPAPKLKQTLKVSSVIRETGAAR